MRWPFRKQHPIVTTECSADISDARATDHTIDVVCSAYKRPGPLRVLVQSFLNQSDGNWRLHVLHDGPDVEFDQVRAAFAPHSERVRFSSTPTRHNDFGHSLRAIGLQETAGDYVLITNDDNYYPPTFLAFVNTAISACHPDAVMVDMVHSHTNPGSRQQLSHCIFATEYARREVDMGAVLVRGDLARRAGFRDKSFAGDATYFEDVAAQAGDGFRVAKIPRVLFYHN
ncbi:MAG: glycosyltransferase family 2 protein [Gemmatimonadaceae bacterium]|nr:glycosyltransferase family 2 protein [Gemmatimonadaceae bacterium]